MNWLSPVRSKSKKVRNQKSCKKDKTFFQSTQVTHEKELVLKTIEKQKDSFCTDSFNLSKFINTESKVIDSKFNSFMRQLDQFDNNDINQSKYKQKLKTSTSQVAKLQNSKINPSKSNLSKNQTKLQQCAQSTYFNCILKLKELCQELKIFINNIKNSYESLMKETMKKVEIDCTNYMIQYKNLIKEKIEKNVSKKYQIQLEEKVKKIVDYSEKNKKFSQIEEKQKVQNKIFETTQTSKRLLPSVKQKIHKLMTLSKKTQTQSPQKQLQTTSRQRFIRNSKTNTLNSSHIKQQVDRSSSSNQLKKLNTHIKQLKDSFN